MELTLVETAALECARDLVSDGRFGELPIDIEQVAKHLGVAEISARDMAPDGYLGRDSRGDIVIRYRSVNGHRRNRFTIAHEVGHLILLNQTTEQCDQTQDGSDREERVVNRIASELLMPAPLVMAELRQCTTSGMPPGWSTLARLAARFEVSLAAIGIRILELPQLNAVSMSIGIEGPGPSRPFRTSIQHHTVRLANGFDYEADRIWRESRRTNRHELLINSGQVTQSIPCEGRVDTLGRGSRRLRQYWIIGWTDVRPEEA
jgi:hypothetical protein